MSDKVLLCKLNESLSPRFAKLNLKVIEDPQFEIWTAAIKHHHNYVGGLLSHTLEVALFCDYAASQNSKINRDILISGAIWHDYGKLWDYEPVYENGTGLALSIKEWRGTCHKNRIYHICRSYHEFLCEANRLNSIAKADIEHIAHLILSHHNLPEYESPRRPQTMEAWALHLADMNSAFVGGRINGINPRVENG
jgi:3'-5' exoribonuclease